MTRATDWTSPDWWRHFAPGLHVEDPQVATGAPPFALPEPLARSLPERLRHEGYFELRPHQWGVPIPAMADAIARLADRRLPTPFAFVYDEFWLLFRQLHVLLEGMLGPGYLRLPDFWAWHVDPRRGDHGWAPHRDKTWETLREDRSPKSLTVWIALTEATPMNGCMYIVPAHRDPTYGTPQDRDWQFGFADVRALPVQPGTILAWTQATAHWGGQTSPIERRPRISAAMEFQSADCEPLNQPLSDPESLPAFAERLRLIGKQILQYDHMYPLEGEMRALAERLRGQG